MTKNTEQRYSIRKNAIGAASVLLGALVFGASNPMTAVSADSTDLNANAGNIVDDGIPTDYLVKVLVDGVEVHSETISAMPETIEEAIDALDVVASYGSGDNAARFDKFIVFNGNEYTVEYTTKPLREIEQTFVVKVVVNGTEVVNQTVTVKVDDLEDTLAGITAVEDNDPSLDKHVVYDGNTYIFEYTTKVPVTKYIVLDQDNFNDVVAQGDFTGQPQEAFDISLRTALLNYPEARYEVTRTQIDDTLMVYVKKKQTPPPAEPLEDFTLILVIDGEQVGDPILYNDITYSQFLDIRAALLEANKDLVQDGVEEVDNVLTLKFSTPVAEEKTHEIKIMVDGVLLETRTLTYTSDDEAVANVTALVDEFSNTYDPTEQVIYWEQDGSNNATLTFKTRPEAKEDFTIILKVDGQERQVTEYKGITHTEFLSHLATLTEAQLSQGLIAGDVVFDGNTVILNYSTPETPAVTDFLLEVYEDGVKVSESTAADEGGLTALEASTVTNKTADGFKLFKTVREGNVLKLYFVKEQSPTPNPTPTPTPKPKPVPDHLKDPVVKPGVVLDLNKDGSDKKNQDKPTDKTEQAGKTEKAGKPVKTSLSSASSDEQVAGQGSAEASSDSKTLPKTADANVGILAAVGAGLTMASLGLVAHRKRNR